VSGRLDYARSFAFEHSVTVVAKGVPSVICGKNGSANLLFSGNPGLSRGGSGDCLTGIIAGLAANRSKADVSSLKTAVDAVGLHGAAADIAAKKFTVHCMTASDVINSIPEVIKGCSTSKKDC
jgi:NAD(P)H-hydrate epimerase